MSNSSLFLAKSELLKKYNELTDDEKKQFLTEWYVDKGLSFDAIAANFGTYPNKVRRDAKRLNIQIRNKSEAQSKAIASGRVEHPTKGKTHSKDARKKISEQLAKSWSELTPAELEERKQMGKESWANLSEAQKDNIRRKANEGIREASKTGSKLEKFLYENLSKAGYIVEFHVERALSNQFLHLDMFLPELGVAIEVDGPSHFKAIWGQKTFQRNLKADSQKTGLVITNGLVMIRVRQTKRLSQKYQSDLLQQLLEKLDYIKNNKLDDAELYMEIV